MTKGFFDYKSAAYGITAGETWLLLGPKGAGKSAVLEHLRLDWEGRWDKFYTYWNLQDFPVADVSRIQTGESSGSARSQSAWQLILLLKVFESLRQDNGLITTPAFNAISKDLGAAGLLEQDWKARVIKWTKASATIKMPVVELGLGVDNSEVGTAHATTILRHTLAAVGTDAQHVIALDGLDQFFFEIDAEWDSLAGLTHAIASVNRLFRDAGSRVSVVAAIRSDIFDVLPSPESNKLKPHTVRLDWSPNGIGKGNLLWEVVSSKARVSKPDLRDSIPKIYLQGPISIGPHSSIPEYFLDNTRLLPRDLIALLNKLKEIHGGSSPVKEGDARECIRQYADDYFVGEIFNNLAGVLPSTASRKLPVFRDALQSLPTRFFSFDDMISELSGVLEPIEIRTLLKQLFEIGGMRVRNYSGAGAEYTDFVFRRVAGAGFTTRHGFLLHNALVVAWNRPWR